MSTTESIRAREQRQENVFNALLGIRFAFYKLIDLNLWKEDYTVQVEVDVLNKTEFCEIEYEAFLHSKETESTKEFKKTFFSN